MDTERLDELYRRSLQAVIDLSEGLSAEEWEKEKRHRISGEINSHELSAEEADYVFGLLECDMTMRGDHIPAQHCRHKQIETLGKCKNKECNKTHLDVSKALERGLVHRD